MPRIFVRTRYFYYLVRLAAAHICLAGSFWVSLGGSPLFAQWDANPNDIPAQNYGALPQTPEATTAIPYPDQIDGNTSAYWMQEPGAFEETGNPPKVHKLGKLVSLEGEAGDRGTLRETRMYWGETLVPGSELDFDPASMPEGMHLPKLTYFSQEPYTNYRVDEDAFSFMPGNGDQFGWISFESSPYTQRGYRSSITTAFNFHLLSGPESVPLPPRLYDFSLGYQKRGFVGDFLSYDLATTVGVFSDFEDSARDGVRFPGHAVGMLPIKPEMDIVFGVDYLSRDDIKLLPVGGISWRPVRMEELRFDLVFPRPRIEYALNCEDKLFVLGRLGGGTWDIEFPNDDNDVMTYRDLQLVLGYESKKADGDIRAFEFGYVFDRRLEFRTLNTVAEFDDAFVFRIVTRK